MLTIAGKKTSTVSMLVLKLSLGCIIAEIMLGVKAMAASGKLKNTFLHFFTLFCKKVKKV